MASTADEALERYKSRGRRRGVSAATTDSQQETDIKDFPEYAKTSEELERIDRAISRCILFRCLDADERRIAMRAMFEVQAPDGHKIIVQGAEGDNFYIVDQGTCEIFVGQTLVKVCGAGDSFGELALMYDAPRAASVVAKGPVRLWAMDRRTYKGLMKRSVEQKRNTYDKFLGGVDFLQPLSALERHKVADFLEARAYNAGDRIVRQGESGDEFFIVAEGRVACTQTYVDAADGSEKEGLLCELAAGQYFGEVALLKGTTRRATVQAVEPTKCLILKAETFNLSMGPLIDYLKRNAALYQSYQQIVAKDSS